MLRVRDSTISWSITLYRFAIQGASVVSALAGQPVEIEACCGRTRVLLIGQIGYFTKNALKGCSIAASRWFLATPVTKGLVAGKGSVRPNHSLPVPEWLNMRWKKKVYVKRFGKRCSFA